jgi:hypothetical protein
MRNALSRFSHQFLRILLDRRLPAQLPPVLFVFFHHFSSRDRVRRAIPNRLFGHYKRPVDAGIDFQAAETILVRDGKGAELGEIATLAGRTKRAIYTQFKRPEDIFLALIEEKTKGFRQNRNARSQSPDTCSSAVADTGTSWFPRLVMPYLQPAVRRPLNRLMTRTTKPTTRSKWIKPPPICRLKPRSHKIRRTTRTVQSMSISLRAREPEAHHVRVKLLRA